MKIGIAGCTGRMGLTLIKTVSETEGVSLAAGSIRPDQQVPQRDFWLANGVVGGEVAVVTDADALFAESDVVIDFTSPSSSMALAQKAAETGKPLVMGTTGLTAEQFQELGQYATKTAILWASNMSIGVTLLAELVREAARKLDPGYDIEIVEMHHRNKVDAPSGTALSLGKAAAEGRGVDFDAMACLSREGITGPRPMGEIGFATLRGGEVIGDHTVVFAGAGERIELSHKSSSRAIYAHGAVRAARWLAGKPAGLYSMRDSLSF